MLKPTIDKQIISWGTTKKPSASYSSQAPSGPTNVEYSELQISNITVPVPNNLGTRPVNLANSKYGWIGAKGQTVASPEIPSNLEYAELQQSHIVVPAPIVIPNFAESQFEETMPEVSEQMPGVSPMQMADIILQYKKESQAADYQQWVIAITAYKKIMIAKTIRDLTTEEKRIMSVVEEQIKNEMQNISLNAPEQPIAVQQPAVDQQGVDDLIEQLRIAQLNTPQRWTQAEIDALYPPRPVFGPPVDTRPISRGLQRFGTVVGAAVSSGAPAGLSASIATIGLTEIARTVASLSAPDLATVGSMLGVGASATAQTIVGAIANSTGEGRLAVIAATFASGGLINYYMTRDAAQPVVATNPVVGAQIPVSSSLPPVVAASPAVGVQSPVDVIQSNQPIMLGPDPGQSFNVIGNHPVQNPNNPWLDPLPGVGDPIAFPIAQPVLSGDDLKKAYTDWATSQTDQMYMSYTKVPELRGMVRDFGIATKSQARKMTRGEALRAINDWVEEDGPEQKNFMEAIYESMQ